MRRLLLKDQKYAQSLIKMGISHGNKFDCMQPECRVCIPYREKEQEEWLKKSQEEREAMTWGVIGLNH